MRRLAYSGFLLFGLFYWLDLLLVFVGSSPDADHMVKSAKIASLIAMNVHGDREVDDIIATSAFSPDLRRYILRSYRFVRGYVWIAVAFVSFVSFLPPSVCKTDTMLASACSPPAQIYLANIAALFPIFFYTYTNYYCIRHRGITDELKNHLKNYLYFVDVPLAVSIVAFFVLTSTMITWTDQAREALFVDGAAAVLLFLSHAMSVCVDRHAEIEYYEEPARGTSAFNRVMYNVLGNLLVVTGLLFGFAAPLHLDWLLVGLFAVAGIAIFNHALWAEGWRWWWVSASVGMLYFTNGIVRLSTLSAHDPFNAWLPHWQFHPMALTALGLATLAASAVLRFVPARRFWSNNIRWTYTLFPIAIFLALFVFGYFSKSLSWQYVANRFNFVLGFDLFVHGFWFLKVSWQPAFATHYAHARTVARGMRIARKKIAYFVPW